MKGNKAFAKVTKDNLLRGCDPKGCGHFGAPRGTRTHAGIDFKAEPGEDVFAPITGKITALPYPYAGDTNYKGIEITNEAYRVRFFYAASLYPVNTVVTAGQKIGTAQNISAKHGATMINHVHFEVYQSGKLVDPAPFFKAPVLNRNLMLKKGLYNSPEVKELQRLLGITADGDFGQNTENALFAKKAVKQITLNTF